MIPVPGNIASQVAQALTEDVGTGDLTAHLLPQDVCSTARIVTRQNMVLAGSPWVNAVFHSLDPEIKIVWHHHEGDHIVAHDVLCTLEGPVAALLTGERTALNFLQTLSATATITAHYVAAVAGTKARILDTRKSLPGLRLAQKYAVRCGGGDNHRMGLYDAILIKENHIHACGDIYTAMRTAREAAAGRDLMIEIEVESLDEFRAALEAKAQYILLDNFSLAELNIAVEQNAGRAQLEASGGIKLDNVATIAATGVDRISIGSLTKDIMAIDLSMRLDD